MKSKVRLKFFGFLFIFYFIGSSFESLIKSPELESLGLLGVFIVSISSLILLTIKCERCGVFIYRYNKKNHGVPDLRCLIPKTTCPVCGVRRL